MWHKSSITPGEIEALKTAAQRAWDEDTRDARWAGTSLDRGQCYVVARWLVDRLGGRVGRKQGHFAWLSPGGDYVIDLACGHHAYTSSDGYEPFRVVDNERTARFSKRADRIFDHLVKTADMIGDAYPAEEPEQSFLNGTDETGPYWHDEPDHEPTGGVYKFVYANGQLEVSQDHDHTELTQHAGVPMDHRGPMATGYIAVTQGRATFEVQSNVNLNSLLKPFKDYCKTVGWQWGGMTNIEGEPISDDFAPARTSRLTYVYDAEADHLWVGRTTRFDLAARAHLAGEPRSAGRLYLSSGGEVAVDHVDPTVLPHLFEWVADNGFTLYALNDNTMKHYEDLQQYNNGDPDESKSNLIGESPEGQDMRTPAGLYECPGCHRLFPNWYEYSQHRRDDEAHVQDRVEDGKFPEIDSDSPFGDGAHWTEQREEPGIHTGAFDEPLSLEQNGAVQPRDLLEDYRWGAMTNPLWPSADEDPYVYHAAPTSERARIQAYGLQPSLPALNPRWDQWEQDRGIDKQPSGIYVAPTWQDASSWMRPNHARHRGEPYDVWRIRKDDVTGYGRDPLAGAHQYITHPVPAELHKGWEDVMPYEDWKRHLGEPSWSDQFREKGDAVRAIEENPQWGIGRPDRVIGANGPHVQWNCPQCGALGEVTMGSDFLGACGHMWTKLPEMQFQQDLKALPEATHPAENWKPEGWDQEAYGPHGRCPMCKNPNLLAMDDNLICPECKWAGQTFHEDA